MHFSNPAICRKVHISKVTMQHLGDTYEVEPGNGMSRDKYLKEQNVETFLITAPSKDDSSVRLN